MKHKLMISTGRPGPVLWYVGCIDCGWTPGVAAYSKKADCYQLGRDTWTEAFDLGVQHQVAERDAEALARMAALTRAASSVAR